MEDGASIYGLPFDCLLRAFEIGSKCFEYENPKFSKAGSELLGQLRQEDRTLLQLTCCPRPYQVMGNEGSWRILLLSLRSFVGHSSTRIFRKMLQVVPTDRL